MPYSSGRRGIAGIGGGGWGPHHRTPAKHCRKERLAVVATGRGRLKRRRRRRGGCECGGKAPEGEGRGSWERMTRASSIRPANVLGRHSRRRLTRNSPSPLIVGLLLLFSILQLLVRDTARLCHRSTGGLLSFPRSLLVAAASFSFLSLRPLLSPSPLHFILSV